MARQWVAMGLLLGTVSMTAGNGYDSVEFKAEKKDGRDLVFEKMVYENVNIPHRIFVSAVNRMYQFDENLSMVSMVDIGPQEDNPLCPVRMVATTTCESPVTAMDVHSKAFLIDYDNKVLINCISLFQGVCWKFDLDNINHQIKTVETNKNIVANNETASTYAFIADSMDEKTKTKKRALYVGVQYVEKGWNRKKIPAFASYRLDNYELVHDDISLYKTMINTDSNLKVTFPIYYKYGFSSENFSYMITVQKNSTDQSKESYISKIFRVCQNDIKFVTYAELHIQCFHSGTLYSLAQTAYLGKAGKNLAEAMGINVSEDVLYVTFSLGPPRSPDPNKASAICVYPMRNIREQFTKNTQDCFRGQGNTGPPHFFKSTPCVDAGVRLIIS